MAYNLRRGMDGLGNIGQRRNPPLSNFIPGGQLAPQNRPPLMHSQGQQGFQNQNNTYRPPPQQNQRMPSQGPQRPPMQKPPMNAMPQQKPPVNAMPQQKPPMNAVPQQKPGPPPPAQKMQVDQLEPQFKAEESSEMMVDGAPGDEQAKRKPFWANKQGKISRKERQRRRNLRLSRMLQPKNAVMILNELVKSAAYTISDVPQPNMHQYMASVLVEESTHVGYGHSKMEAKNNAAEAALKHIVKNRKLTAFKKEEDSDEKMEEMSDDQNAPLPWQHVASFALYKLLNSWGEDPFQSRTVGQSSPEGSIAVPQNKPAKKMPENAAHMNPLMLLNQMLPHAQFEELGRSGDPPNLIFTFKCAVDDQTFMGSGPNKKSAKKMAAFAVCHKILAIQYPPEIYTPTA